MNIASLLGQLEQFKTLHEREIELLCAQAILRPFNDKEILFFEGEETPYWYFVVQGTVRAYKSSRDEHTVSLCILEQGMAVNDIHIMGAGYRASMFATIEGINKGILIAFKASALNLLISQIPSFALICFHSSLTSIERYQRSFFSGMVLDAAGKVAFMLVHDIARFNTLKKQEVASYLNIQPETLSRILGKFARRGVIEVQGMVKITDIQALKEYYE